MTYRPGRSSVARAIEQREKLRARIGRLRAMGLHRLADKLERESQAPTPAVEQPADRWWDR